MRQLKQCGMIWYFAIILLLMALGRPGIALCPSPAEISSIINTELQSLVQIEKNLKSLVDGKSPISVMPLDKILGVNLSDDADVQTLRTKLIEEESSPFLTLQDRFPECEQFSEDQKKFYEQIHLKEASILKIKLELLNLEKTHRDLLLEAYRISLDQSETSATLNEAKKQASKALKTAIQEQNQAQVKLVQEQDETLKMLASERARLEQVKINLSEIHLRITTEFEEAHLEARTSLEKLQKLQIEPKPMSLLSLQFKYEEVNSLWRLSVDKSLEVPPSLVVPEIPKMNASVLDKLKGSREASFYKESIHKAIEYRKEILIQFNESLDHKILNQYKLLVQVGKVRSEYLKALRELGNKNGNSFSEPLFPDYLRELKIVPFRILSLFRLKVSELSSAMDQGIGNTFKFIQECFLFLVFLFIPFALFWLLGKIRRGLEKFRFKLVQSPRHRTKTRIQIAIILHHLTPYFQWVFSFFAVLFAEDILKETVWEEISFILPYFRFYIIYRIFLLAFQSGLGNLVRLGEFGSAIRLRNKATKTGRIIGLFFLFVFFVLHATETMVGEALIYHLVKGWMFYLGVIMVIVAAYAWRLEIATAGVKRSNAQLLAKIFPRLCRGRASFLTAALALLLLVGTLLYQKAFEELSELEAFKRISAKVLRKKLEATGKHGDLENIEALPEKYTKWFDYGIPSDKDIWLEPPDHIFDKMNEELRDLVDGKAEENTLAIFGEKGSGKSSLFKLLSNRPMENVKIINAAIPPKILTRDQSINFFSELLNVDLSGGYSKLIEQDKKLKMTIYLLDDAHNFFLADIGAFEGFKAFLELINVRLKNVNWAAAFNSHSWHYLNSVFGRNHFFRTLIPLPNWSEKDIRDLILSRHKKSDFRLKYERVVFATQGLQPDFEDYAESSYFRLLWEQSCGNPRSAMYLWLTSLKRHGGTIKVALPEETNSDVLTNLQQESLFVYAAIIRHENLTTEETMRVTDLPEGVVRHAIKIGLERNFLYSSDSRYRLSAGWHNIVVNYLTRRNYLYGS